MSTTRSLTPTVTTLESRMALSTSTFSPVLVMPPSTTSPLTTITSTVTPIKSSVLAPGNALNFYGAVEAPIIVPATSGEGSLVSYTPIIVTARDFEPGRTYDYYATTPLASSPISSLS